MKCLRVADRVSLQWMVVGSITEYDLVEQYYPNLLGHP